MNWTTLIQATLPITALEIAALLVLVVDLVVLPKAAKNIRLNVAAVLGVLGCFAAYHAFGVTIAAGVKGYALNDGGHQLLSYVGASAIAQIAVLALTALTLLLLFGTKFTNHPGEFVATTLFSASGGLLVAAAQDLLVLFVGLELLSLGLYILAAFSKSSEKSAESALKYYLFGGMSAAFMLFGFSYLYGLAGTTEIRGIVVALIANMGLQSPLYLVALVLVAAGLGFKVAAVPFHLWAPDAYEGAPIPAAAFTASASKVASFALLAGLSGVVFDALKTSPIMACCIKGGTAGLAVILVMATASMIVGNLAALAQISVRRLLAYSAIAHGGYILLGVYSGFLSADLATRSANSVLYYIVTYGLTTIGAFGVIGIIEQKTDSGNLDALSGLHKRNPLLAGVLLILLLSLAGIPPLVGFWAKFNLFAAVLAGGGGVIPFTLVALAVGLSSISLYYYLRVLKYAYVLEPIEGTGPISVHPVTMVVLLAIAAAVVLLGIFPSVLGDWIARTGNLVL